MFSAAFDPASDADRKMRYAVDEVGSAIQWVDNPHGICAVALARLKSGLFSLDAVIGVCLAQMGNNGLLGGAVNFGHVVASVLLVDGKNINTFHGTVDHFSGATCGAEGDVQHGLHRDVSLSGR